jgi:hypothetical protein
MVGVASFSLSFPRPATVSSSAPVFFYLLIEILIDIAVSARRASYDR